MINILEKLTGNEIFKIKGEYFRLIKRDVKSGFIQVVILELIDYNEHTKQLNYTGIKRSYWRVYGNDDKYTRLHPLWYYSARHELKNLHKVEKPNNIVKQTIVDLRFKINDYLESIK